MWYDDVRTELARYKESCCDGRMWVSAPKTDEAYSNWSAITWSKFDQLPVSNVADIIKNIGCLNHLLTKDYEGSQISDIYQILDDIENWTFDDVKKLHEHNEEAFSMHEIGGKEYIGKANMYENAFGIEETQCLCYCCRHSGECPMEDSHNTTYGTFVTECHFHDPIEEG